MPGANRAGVGVVLLAGLVATMATGHAAMPTRLPTPAEARAEHIEGDHQWRYVLPN